MIYKSDKLAVIIDGLHLSQLRKSLDLNVDYRKLRDYFVRAGRLSSLTFYALVDDDPNNPIVPLLDWMSYNGYSVFRGAAYSYVNDEGRKIVRGSVAVKLSLDLVEASRTCDHIVLIGGDPDYAHALNLARRNGCQITVISSLAGAKHSVSDALRRTADEFVEIDTIMQHIEKDD